MSNENRNPNNAEGFDKRVQTTDALIEALLLASTSKNGLAWKHDQSQPNTPYPAYTLRKELPSYGQVTLVIQRNQYEARESYSLCVLHDGERIAFTEESTWNESEYPNDLKNLYTAAANTARTLEEDADLKILQTLLKELESGKPEKSPSPYVYAGIEPPSGVPFPVDMLVYVLILIERRNRDILQWNRVEVAGHRPAFFVDLGGIGTLHITRKEEIEGVSDKYTLCLQGRDSMITATESDFINRDSILLELYSLLSRQKPYPR